MTSPRYALEDLGWERVDELLEKRVVHAERMSLTNYRFAPGGRFPHHVHPQEQLTYCLQGSVEFVVGRTAVTIRPGELVVIPPDEPHAAQAGADGALVLSLVSPSRRDGDDGITLLEG